MIIHRQNRAMIVLLAAIFLIYPLLAFAQRPPAPQEIKYSPQLVSEIKKVQQAALENDYAYRQLAHLSNNIGPRLSGSPQAQAAVEYVAAHGISEHGAQYDAEDRTHGAGRQRGDAG
ncbi:MAG: hypothetical protein DMF75_20810 [Acidobacteria bacterium]|nr:MAG: hypothetical protein DMF75_20810 [Acidobacteriota bacterium]